MKRSHMLRPLPASPIDVAAQRKRALSQRGYCRKHYRSYPLNVMYQGVLRVFACVDCHPSMRVYESRPWGGKVSG